MHADQGAQVLAFPARTVEGGGLWEPWLDEQTVARHFGVSPRTVRRWRTQGLPSQKWRGVRRFRLSQCEAWLNSNEGTAR